MFNWIYKKAINCLIVTLYYLLKLNKIQLRNFLFPLYELDSLSFYFFTILPVELKIHRNRY